MGGQRPQLRIRLVSLAHLLQRAPPHPELVGDDEGVSSVALVLAAVALAGAIDRHARQVEHPLAPPEQDGLQQGGRPAREVDPEPPALAAEALDLLAAALKVPLGGLHPAREQHLALVVQHADPVEGLPDVEPHPQPHLRPPFPPPSPRPRPPGPPAVLALTRRSVLVANPDQRSRGPSGRAGGTMQTAAMPREGRQLLTSHSRPAGASREPYPTTRLDRRATHSPVRVGA